VRPERLGGFGEVTGRAIAAFVVFVTLENKSDKLARVLGRQHPKP